MKTPFAAPARSYAGDEPDTPYRRARQEWDRRMGSAVLSARAWRTMAIAGLALSGALAGALTLVALQKRTFVHVVEVSPEGEVLNVRAAHEGWRPSEAQVAYHLGRFVRLVRAQPTDAVVLRENWIEAYKFLTPNAAAHLTALAREDDPFASLGRVGRVVHVRAILQRSDKSWEVTWVERETNASGAPIGQAYNGIFTVTTRKPRTADELAANPLGLLISDFSWSRVR